MRPPRFISPIFFFWLIVPLLIWLAITLFGTPHIIFSYDWRALGPNSRVDFSQRYYTRCTFWGATGWVTYYPTDGRCGLIRFFKAGADQ